MSGRIPIFLLILTIFMSSLTVSAETIRNEDGDLVVMTVPDTQGMSVGAEAAIVVEARTGRVMFAQNAEARLPFASTTKIMTALITLEQPDLDAVFVVDPQAIKVEGSSMGLQEGDRASLRALAVGMLLASGNDAANAAAVRISGSIPDFVDLMNQRAREMGLQNTSFETPSGLDGDNHYSTAADLATLARSAMLNPDFRSICSQYKMRTSYGDPPYDRWLTNHNRLLNYYDDAIGIKTGFTKKAGRCLVSAAARDGIELICVTLDCPDDWNTHENLFNRFFGELTLRDLTGELPEIKVPVTGGAVTAVTAITYDAAKVPLPASGVEVTWEVTAPRFLYAPVTLGQSLGEVRILVDGEHLSTLTLIAGEEAPLKHPYEEKTGLWQKITDFFAA